MPNGRNDLGAAALPPGQPGEQQPPKFLYFDLGKVLVDFSVQQMCRQMSAASGAAPEQVWQALFNDQLQKQYELGRISGQEFYETFCQKTGTRPDYHALETAASDIFVLNLAVVPLVAHLRQAGYPLGILSNTCRSHWEHCRRRFRILAEDFDVCALSFEIGACKPEPAIFEAAAAAAGAAADEIFFVDDFAENVAGARAAGLDAVPYTTAAELAADLRKRGVRFNY
jgi:HAD superfamily hydrolase (TIGR01509 family)